MVLGYTLIDPLVVLWGTSLAIRFLQRAPAKLIGFMPTALSLWFFVPIVTNLTLWQTVPLLLSGRMLLKSGLRLPKSIKPLIFSLMIIFVIAAGFAMFAGADKMRMIIRIVYYVGILSTLAFAYEMGRRHDTYEILLKGLVVMGLVYSVYGAYQIVAFYTGFPVRGIVYDASGEGIMAFSGGLLRINSFANEPKRLGYILFLAAMAAVFLAQIRPAQKARQLRWAAAGIFLISIMTFAISYYFAILLFSLGVLLFYTNRAMLYVFGAVAIGVGVSVLVPELGIVEAIQKSYASRTAEIDVGLSGAVVYRQEFFAIDYLSKNPISYLTGVGVGQYYSVLNSTYGNGAGYSAKGALAPINSLFIELIFDIGIIATGLIYSGLIILVFRLRRARENFFCLGLIFLVAQSLTILNFLYIALFAGVALGRLALRRERPFLNHRQAGC